VLVESSRAAATTVEEDAMVEVMFVPDVCAYFSDGSDVGGQEETDRLSEPPSPGSGNPPLNSF